MLIGVNGQIGSGKDAFYERAQVIAQRGYPVPERRAFADKLKDSFCALFGLTREQLEELKRDDDAVVTVSTPRVRFLKFLRRVHARFTIRLGLQREGTEAGRDIFGDTFWVDQCVPPDLNHDGQLIIVTDVRFPNEAQRIREVGGIVIRMLNGPLIETGHPSEQILPASLVNLEVDNSRRDDDFANLDKQVEMVLRMHEPKLARPGVQVEFTPRRVHTGTRTIDPVAKVSEEPPSWTELPTVGPDHSAKPV